MRFRHSFAIDEIIASNAGPVTGPGGAFDLGSSNLRKWICIIAGGPDHGALVPQWCDFTDSMPPPFDSSDGRPLEPISSASNGDDHRCVMMHPRATPFEVDVAVAMLTGTLETLPTSR
jgi:hypothetical protein